MATKHPPMCGCRGCEADEFNTLIARAEKAEKELAEVRAERDALIRKAADSATKVLSLAHERDEARKEAAEAKASVGAILEIVRDWETQPVRSFELDHGGHDTLSGAIRAKLDAAKVGKGGE